jgi:hypothetical protein
MASVTLATRVLDPARDQVTVSADAPGVDAEVSALVLSDGYEKNYVQDTFAAAVNLQGERWRVRAERSALTGADAASAGLRLPGAEMGIGYLGGYGGAADPQTERRVLPYARLTETATAGKLSGSLSADAIASIGIFGSDAPFAFDSAQLRLSGSWKGVSAQGSLLYHDPTMYLLDRPRLGLDLSLDANKSTLLASGLTLGAVASLDVSRAPDTIAPLARARALVSVSKGEKEAHIVASVASDLTAEVSLGVSGPAFGVDFGVNNQGPTAALHVTAGKGKRVQADEASLDRATDPQLSDLDTSRQRVFALLARGDPGALFALRDITGAYGWIDEPAPGGVPYEASAQATEDKGAGDCTDQATLWSYYINRYGRAHFEPFVFMYHRADEKAGHGILIVREKSTGRAFALEYGQMYLLQGLGKDASAAEIAEAARSQLSDPREALSRYSLFGGATNTSQNLPALDTLYHHGSATAAAGPRAIPLRGVDTLIGRDAFFGSPRAERPKEP